MTIDLLKDRGTPLDRQKFTWKELVQPTYSKLDDDAFTRVRVILMNGIETESLRFSHSCARMNRDLQLELARIRRIEQHQQTMVNWLNPADQSPLETTIGYEQVAIEVTASIALKEPDPYLAQVYRFGLLEDFDHMYRYSALMDRVEGKDANNILQSYTDILPGRPTVVEHRHPDNDLRLSYDRSQAVLLTKLHALTLVAGEHQTHDYYMNIGPTYPDPTGRQLYAEIASIEEQHVTQYESLMDATETWLEKWLIHEATEVYNYYSCVESESNKRIKAIWERFLDYELGHLRHVAELFERVERRDAAEVLQTGKLPAPIAYESHREFVRETLRNEATLTAVGPNFVAFEQESSDNTAYREQLNSEGSPSERVALGYVFRPGTELKVQSPRTSADPTTRHVHPNV
jgi:rubrerythrin